MIQSSESDSKSRLIKQICDVSTHAKSCVHRNTLDSDPPFIDWYILLQVEDDVSLEMIRKKYYKYALLLHPDKNKHPKAEFAFKLVSEAYACLSDESKRSEFDSRRSTNICSECIKTPNSRTKVKGSSSADRSRSKKISAKIKEVRARFKEEARVIEKCLKANANANADVLDKQIPIFDPNCYGNQGYPHFWRCKDPKNSKWFDHEQVSKVKCDSPVFEFKTNRASFKIRS